MGTTKWAAIVVAAAMLVAAGCRTPTPVYNVANSPISTSKTNPSLDEVGKTIVQAGASLGWQMRQTKPGHVLGTLYLRRHVAVVDITYSAKSYSINYKDSTELDYDGANIHPNYNGWIQNLDNRIRAQLSAL
ncbi:MAG TPA: hypothetical protein VLD15_00980 [Burkholderiales bacterium]|nr:hypothetical protein [Burkholderiales bacterium]